MQCEELCISQCSYLYSQNKEPTKNPKSTLASLKRRKISFSVGQRFFDCDLMTKYTVQIIRPDFSHCGHPGKVNQMTVSSVN